MAIFNLVTTGELDAAIQTIRDEIAALPQGQPGLTEARVNELIDAKLTGLPTPTDGVSEARVNELIDAKLPTPPDLSGYLKAPVARTSLAADVQASLAKADTAVQPTTPPPPTAIPAPPKGLKVLSAQSTATTITLDWDDSTDLRPGDKYQIYVNDDWSGRESTTSQYTVTGLTAGTYQFRIGAGQAGSYSGWSDPPVPGATTGTTQPPPTGAAINRPGNPLLIAFGDTVVPTTTVKTAWSKPGAMIIAGRANFGAQWLKDCAAGGATILAYLHPHLMNPYGRYAEKLYLASEFGAAVPNWPGGPYRVDEWGTLADFRVGSLCNTKLRSVLNLMLTENPHLSGFFLDGLGTRAYPGAGGFSWDAFTMKAEYRAGAIAQAQIAREICDARNAMVIANGFWQGGDGGGYPDATKHGCSLLDGQMIEGQPPVANGFHHQYCVGPNGQWGLAVPRIAAMPVPRGYMVFLNPTVAQRDAWVALNAGSHYAASADYSTLDMPWRTFTDFKMPNRKV